VNTVDKPSLDMRALNTDGVLSPVLPLFEDRDAAQPIEAASAEQAQLALMAKLSDNRPAESKLMLTSDVNALLDGKHLTLVVVS
jgi:hypothetical protein